MVNWKDEIKDFAIKAIIVVPIAMLLSYVLIWVVEKAFL